MKQEQSTDDEKIAAWAVSRAEAGSRRAKLGVRLGFDASDWDSRRAASAAMACEAVQAGLAGIGLDAPPSALFDEDGMEARSRGRRVGRVWGQLCLESARRSFWPVDRRVAHTDDYVNLAPAFQGHGVAEHWGMRAATALAGRAAMALLARRSALALIKEWVLSELAQEGGGAWGPQLRAAWEADQIGAQAAAPAKKAGRARSL